MPAGRAGRENDRSLEGRQGRHRGNRAAEAAVADDGGDGKRPRQREGLGHGSTATSDRHKGTTHTGSASIDGTPLDQAERGRSKAVRDAGLVH
jgi:hypothetical protein